MSTHAQDGLSPWTAASEEAVVAIRRLTKRYGASVAVDDLTFSLPPRTVAGFLGSQRL